MSCPYFYPVEALANAGPKCALLPLGDAWGGVCRAVPELPWEPGPATLRPLCNLGYARGACTRFPAGDGPDAVRFAISRNDGESLLLRYVLERDHLPFAHGTIEYSTGKGAFTGPGADELGEVAGRQARAYVDSYLRRSAEQTV